jgi:hypothetical protein
MNIASEWVQDRRGQLPCRMDTATKVLQDEGGAGCRIMWKQGARWCRRRGLALVSYAD